jgi:FHA domain/Domain of unknown function (DUF4388)
VAPGPAAGPYALRFLAGRYQGGSLPVEIGRSVTVGRAAGCDLILEEELTSRRHAALLWEGEVPVIEDLGSTNGTFVNGERIQRRRLTEGDRILIGGNILKLVSASRPGVAAPPARDVETAKIERTVMESLPQRASAMQGRLEEVGLPDLLQLLGTSRKSGVLQVASGERRGAVRLGGGRITHCVIEGSPALSPAEVIAEMVQWADGSFELLPAQSPPPGPALDEPVDAVLIEALRRLDERNRE